MARKPPPGPCVHCLRHSDDLTWDHVFPRAWYPDGTPGNLKKWKIPSCRPCNQEYGVLEDDLLLRLGMCIGPEDAAAAGIGEKALRSVKPEFARDERDRKARESRRQSLLEELVEADTPPEPSFPGFGPRPYLQYDKYHIVQVPEEPLHRLGEKVIRGLTYIDHGSLITDRHRITLYFAHEEKVREVIDIIRHHGKVRHRGPGIVVVSAHIPEDPITGLWRIIVWGELRIYGSVVPCEAPGLSTADSASMRG